MPLRDILKVESRNQLYMGMKKRKEWKVIGTVSFSDQVNDDDIGWKVGYLERRGWGFIGAVEGSWWCKRCNNLRG